MTPCSPQLQKTVVAIYEEVEPGSTFAKTQPNITLSWPIMQADIQTEDVHRKKNLVYHIAEVYNPAMKA